ncbi:MAG: hypothetical protein LBQ88_08970 [Treponema sp.]|jgi:hypothetical protein|nr:hypothetical protein [Treponema sp.]
MKAIQKKLACAVFMLIICGGLFSQESIPPLISGTPEARVYFAEGTDFVVTSNGRRTIYRAEDLAAGGFILNKTDMIQTGIGSLVEFQISPAAHTGDAGGQTPVKAAVVKIAENTSFLYNGWNAESGRISLFLLYGRLRLITGEGGGAYHLTVESGNAAVDIAKGDMGLDYIIQSSLLSLKTSQTKPLLRVYSFQGNAELILYKLDGIQAADTLTPRIKINENETITIETVSPLSFIERKPLEDEILTYWDVHNFKGEAPAAMPEISLPLPPPAITPVIVNPVPDIGPLNTPPDYSRFIKANRKKNTILIIGTVLTLAGAAMEGYAAYSVSTGNNDMNIFIPLSAIPLGIGITTMIGGILYNPRYKTP